MLNSKVNSITSSTKFDHNIEETIEANFEIGKLRFALKRFSRPTLKFTILMLKDQRLVSFLTLFLNNAVKFFVMLILRIGDTIRNGVCRLANHDDY
jgi:hypothetical protein